MAVRSRVDLDRDLKQGKIAPVYLLFGCETYLRAEAVRAISEEALRDNLLRDFNEAQFSLAQSGVGAAVATAEQLPMMAARRVVRLKDFTKLTDADEEALLRYLARPAESSVVIFIADDLDKRRKLSKVLMQDCAAFEFTYLKDAELARWARSYAKSLKAEIDERTLQRVIELVGSDVQILSNELSKLATAALPSGTITTELVDALVGRSREFSNFDLTDHLIARNSRMALQTLKHLLADGAEPVMLIGLIASNYHRLALARELLTRGSRQEVFRQVPMPVFKQNQFLALVQRSDPEAIAHGLKRIAATDLGIKTSLGGGGVKGAQMQLEMLVCELAT
ncbi:MAG: polymerase subunit delta [Blastocatellia bacterium]|jgi:DNA polymerase-3 subunit delta|nr:polymerase subunit delta [Blastocatellia bacterium]